MQSVTRDWIQYVFDRPPAPVLRVTPGELFEVETEDARTGRTRTPETLWLGECSIGTAGGQAFLNSPGLADVIFLLLFHNPLDEPTKAALRERFGAAVRV
jgi:hypothetical protein